MHSDDDKPTGFGHGIDSSPQSSTSSPAPRARNRTVMLTPEMTGQVRSEVGDTGMLGGDRESSNSGFERPRGGGFQSFGGGTSSAFDSGAFGGFGGQENESSSEYQFGGSVDSSSSSHQASGLVEDPYASPFSQSSRDSGGFGGGDMSNPYHTDHSDPYSGGQGFGGYSNGASEAIPQHSSSGNFIHQSHSAQPEPVQQSFQPEPVTPAVQPVVSQPVVAQPVTRQPVAQPPVTQQPVAQQPAVAQPAGGILKASEPESDLADERIVWLKESPIVGFLVCFENNKNGEVLELRSGRLIITAEPPSSSSSSNYLYINHDTVSPNHAIMKITRHGEIQVLDQLSEHGTRIRRFGSREYIQLSGDKSTLDHGDVVKFGDRTFHVCVLSIEEEPGE